MPAIIFRNVAWYSLDRVVRMLLGLAVGVWIARYLGPGDFGALSYAIAMVALFATLAEFGAANIVVRDLVSEPQDAKHVLGAAALLLQGTAICAYILLILSQYFLGDGANTSFVILLGISLLFKPGKVIEYWFQSKMDARSISLVSTSAFLVASIARVFLIFAGATVIAFVWVILAEVALTFFGMLAAYLLSGERVLAWRPTTSRIRAIASRSWPTALTGLVIVVYMRIDQVMLGVMLSSEEVGIYSAAVQISEAWYFVPTAIAVSFYPSLVDVYRQSVDRYSEQLQRLYTLVVWLAVAMALVITVAGGHVIELAYGKEYASAANVLVIHLWAGVFVAYGVVKARAVVLENMQKFSLVCTFCGCVANIGLNYVLIPNMGGEGAAIATLIAQFVSAILVPIMYWKDRHNVHMFFKTFLFIGVVKSRI